ncbi:MAG TPA: 5-(carboxyamino)imidazole ribonucleotide synthase [Bryobacteraceae bacterium]|nr:5-(carboxyamino)imidazole ribonucleotide synthase [Bryobacteraceae bacterium]
MIQPILPGATIGVLGSGQLGRMFAIAARRMGYRVHTFSPDQDTPTGQIADVEVVAPYDDLDAVRNFARNVGVVTFEFENVPADTARAAASCAPVRPSGSILHTTQQRIREKSFLTSAGLPTTPYREIRSPEDLARAISELGCPAILKTAAFGYDGKGQVRVESPERAEAAWDAIGRQEAVLEALIDFDREISVVAARGGDGAFVHYSPAENQHSRHILDVSIAPARVPPAVAKNAVEMSRCVLEKLGVVGVLCVEFFVTRDGRLLINELAPRPHNSGHLTVDACVTSQFEQQLRAVCGLPLGSTAMHCPAAMANILGDLWSQREPDWAAACAFPNVKLHLYGKLAPRPGRKMGHLTALHHDAEEAYRTVLAARQSLTQAG